MTKDEALRLALEAMNLANSSHNTMLLSDPPQSAWRYHNVDMKLREAIIAIKAALEAKDEPVAWGVFEGNLHDMFFTQEEAQEMADLKGSHAEVRPLYTTPPAAQPEQEPVAWFSPSGLYRTRFHAVANGEQLLTPLYTTPPAAAQRPWQGLTPEDLAQIDTDEFWQVGNHMAIAMAVEDKLKERNT